MLLATIIFALSFQDSQRDSSAGSLDTSTFVADFKPEEFANLRNAKAVWVTQCQKTNARPVIAGDKVVLVERLNADKERVRCFRLTTGKVVWEHVYDAPLHETFDGEFGWGPHSTPTLHNNFVVTIGTSGHAWALDLESGAVEWHRDLWSDFPNATLLERGLAASPLIEAGQVIIPLGGRNSGIIALSADNGQTIWSSTDFDSAYTSPIVGELCGRRQIIVLMSDVLCGLDNLTGQLLWQTPFKTANSVHVASPVIIDKQLVLAGSSDSTRLLRITSDDGRFQVEEVWRTNRCTPQVGNYLRFDQRIIAPASGGSANFTVCLDLLDGTVVWKERFGGRGCFVELQDGFLTINERGDLSVRRIDQSSTQEVVQLPNFGEPPQWGGPSFGSGYMVFQVGDELRAWKLR